MINRNKRKESEDCQDSSIQKVEAEISSEDASSCPAGEVGEVLQSDKMRNTKIGKLLWTMSLPAIFSMLVQSLYNIVDSLFLTGISYDVVGYVGKDIGNDSFTAVSIVMPLTMVVVAIGIGVGVGANAYIARKLGEGNREDANKAAKSAIVLGVGFWLLMLVLSFIVPKPFMRLFVEEGNVSDVNYVINQGALYLQIYLAGSIGVIIDITCARILQSTGNMKIPMITQLVGALTNIGLDALFIVVFKWGVLGAILATVIGQWAAAIIDIVAFVVKKQDVSISLKNFKPEKHHFMMIAKIGAPAFIMNVMGSVVTIIMNTMLKGYSNGIAVLSAYFKVQSFIFMPIFGLMQGAMPILSYNYGANEKKRFNDTFKLGLYIALGVMVLGTLLFQIFPDALMSIFKSASADEAKNALLVEEGAYAFRAISIAFIPAAFSILIINMLQSINCPVSSLLMSLSRQLLFLIPSAILFNYLWQQSGIWYCYPVAEVLSLIVYIPFAIRDYKKQFSYKAKQYSEHLLG